MKKKLNNPVLSGELKVKMRGWKTALGVTLYLGIMVFIAYLFFSIYAQEELRYGVTVNAANEVGTSTYIMLAVVQFVMIIIITPALTAGGISKEREMQTLDLLLCTPMSTGKIIMGKLVSSISFILLLIISSIPLFSLVFLFGGVAPLDIIKLFIFYLITAFAIGSIGIFCSVFLKKTSVAAVVTYVIIFTVGLITAILGLYLIQMHEQSLSNQVVQQYQAARQYVPMVWYFNPGIGFIELLAQKVGASQFIDIFGAGGKNQISFWVKNCVVISAIAVLLLTASAIKLRPVKKRATK